MPYILACASSLLLFIASPGEHFLPQVMWVALVPLLWMACTNSPRTTAKAGFLCGLLYYMGILYWILIVLGTYGNLPLVVSLPALLLLASYMALYMAFFAWACAYLKNSSWFFLATPALWTALDLIRGHLLTGFPWLDLGYSQYNQMYILQCADLFGHYGITFALVFVNTLIAGFFNKQDKTWQQWVVSSSALLAIGTAVFLYATNRIATIDTAIAQSPSLSIGIVQGNIDQSEKWQRTNQRKTVATYLKLSESLLADDNDSLIIWPETALPFFPKQNPLFTEVTAFLDNNKEAALITGAPHYVFSPESNTVHYFNSAFVLTPYKGGRFHTTESRLKLRYDKQHLVPFGEYIPFAALWPKALPLVESMGNFTAGRSLKPISCLNARLGVLICYESIFPDLARLETNNGATVLVNLTNDAWYGRSSAPWQQLAMAVLRAVENRRSLARSANTGISCIVDPVGRQHQRSALFKRQSLRGHVTLLERQTFFVRYGFLFPYLCLLSLIPLVYQRRCRQKNNS